MIVQRKYQIPLHPDPAALLAKAELPKRGSKVSSGFSALTLGTQWPAQGYIHTCIYTYIYIYIIYIYTCVYVCICQGVYMW